MADSDYTPAEALVEALAESLHDYYVRDMHGDPRAWQAADEDLRDESRHAARHILTTHRLVSLPSEPTGWEVEVAAPEGVEWEQYETRTTADEIATLWLDGDGGVDPTTGRIRPVYTIPGEPIDVTGDDNA